MKNSDLKKKKKEKKGLKMHIETKETFPNMLKIVVFSHLLKKKCCSEIRTNTNFDNAV